MITRCDVKVGPPEMYQVGYFLADRLARGLAKCYFCGCRVKMDDNGKCPSCTGPMWRAA